MLTLLSHTRAKPLTLLPAAEHALHWPALLLPASCDSRKASLLGAPAIFATSTLNSISAASWSFHLSLASTSRGGLHFLVSSSFRDGPLVKLSGCCCSVANSCLTLCDPVNSRQNSRLLCPSLFPRVCSHSCPLSQWCYLTISSSAASFSSGLQSFPASGSFLMSRLFISGGKVLKLQLQHQSFQWTFRVDFL